MKILLFFRSGAWRNWGRWKRCAEVVGPAGFFVFCFLACLGILVFNETYMWFVFLPIPLMVLAWFFLLMKPDWYAKIKYDDGRKAYFAVFGTRYLYSGKEWLKGRFVRFSFDKGFEVFSVSEVFRADRTILVKSVVDGYIVYQPEAKEKIFIGSRFDYSYNSDLFDNRKQISVLLEDGVLMLKYDAEKYVHNSLVCGGGVSYVDVVCGEVYDSEAFRERQREFGCYSQTNLALLQENGAFAIYVLSKNSSRGFGLVCRLIGGNKIQTIEGSVYVEDLQDFSLYRLEK